jgi:hypothetical protein
MHCVQLSHRRGRVSGRQDRSCSRFRHAAAKPWTCSSNRPRAFGSAYAGNSSSVASSASPSMRIVRSSGRRVWSIRTECESLGRWRTGASSCRPSLLPYQLSSISKAAATGWPLAIDLAVVKRADPAIGKESSHLRHRVYPGGLPRRPPARIVGPVRLGRTSPTFGNSQGSHNPRTGGRQARERAFELATPHERVQATGHRRDPIRLLRPIGTRRWYPQCGHLVSRNEESPDFQGFPSSRRQDGIAAANGDRGQCVRPRVRRWRRLSGDAAAREHPLHRLTGELGGRRPAPAPQTSRGCGAGRQNASEPAESDQLTLHAIGLSWYGMVASLVVGPSAHWTLWIEPPPFNR